MKLDEKKIIKILLKVNPKIKVNIFNFHLYLII